MWQKANSLCAKSRDKEAIEIYNNLEPKDGLKQVILAQTANAYYRLGQKYDAKRYYKKAQQSEQQWGMRRNPATSKYIKEYCNFYLTMLDFETVDDECRSWVEHKISELSNIAANQSVKTYYLPLPIKY